MAKIFSTATVFVMRPPEISLGEFLAEMRSWLDSKKIEPIAFKSISRDEYEVSFKSFDEAYLFEKNPIVIQLPNQHVIRLHAPNRDRSSVH
jgi:hypothetical protein